MKVVGVDLAGSQRNDTGFCVLTVDESDKKEVSVRLLKTDEEIIQHILEAQPQVIAIDSPLTYKGSIRRCDELLAGYGVLSPTLPGMEILAKRGTNLAEKLRQTAEVIEISVKTSAKILGVAADKNDLRYQKNLMNLNIGGDITTRFLTKDELDAIVAASTAFLYTTGSTEKVGDENGTIITPKV
ncbi:Uncharacterised protein [uncultured archaeon]|nr:Uncharacterised protein [uncultured archaeon]